MNRLYTINWMAMKVYGAFCRRIFNFVMKNIRICGRNGTKYQLALTNLEESLCFRE